MITLWSIRMRKVSYGYYKLPLQSNDLHCWSRVRLLSLHSCFEGILLITIFYNIAQFCLVAIGWPLILALVLIKKKYRKRIPSRLGWQLHRKFPIYNNNHENNTTFWVHALSVGEVTSAIPLVTKIRQTWPESRIVVTVTTTTGEAVANTRLAETADVILPSPIDLLPVVQRYLQYIEPDIYIQVETDFWPNLLTLLNRKKIPTLLVNGRISQKSLGIYKKFAFFFAPMFGSFNHLVMQTQADTVSMRDFGVTDEQLLTLGNLKFDIPTTFCDSPDITTLLPTNRTIFVAGSTHEGEEEIIFSVYRELRQQHPELYLILVPRNPDRGEKLKQLAGTLNLKGLLRSISPKQPADLLIVDTIGELVQFYQHSSIAFVGGSLVSQGGHNPIEPAIMGVPVVYGQHMEDFQEIAEDLLTSGGGYQVSGPDQLRDIISEFITNPDKRKDAGSAARACIMRQQGVIDKHIQLIRSLL